MRRIKIVVFFLLLVPLTLFSQTNEVDEFIDELLGGQNLVDEVIKSTTSYHTIQAGVGFNEKTFFSGRDIGIEQFHIVPTISYIHLKGFFSGVSGVYYSGFSPKWDYTSILVGYGNSFDNKKRFNWSVSYAKYIYSNEIEGLFENAVSSSFDYLNKDINLGSTLEVSFLFGGDTSFQLTSTTYKDFKLFKLKDFELSIRPQVEIVVAQQTIEQARVEGNGIHQETIYTQNDEFGLINTSIKIPIEFSYKSFDFELGYTLNIPNSLPQEESLSTTGFFNVSVAYLFLFN